jgi:Ca2+-binding EF-hand superfamily protein
MERMMMGPGRPGGGFGLLEFDANGDGKLTRAEFDAALHARFNDVDANKDGFVTPDEFRAHREKAEADAEAARFQIMDTDHNGQISKAEYDAAPKYLKDDRGPGRPGPGFAHMRAGGPGFGPPGRSHGGPHGADGKPDDTDPPGRGGPQRAGADGKISFEEFSSRATEAFARADLNKDNIVTIAELQTLTRAMR